jgi:predicted transposase/invertase (TIGR01784 family)
MDICSFYTYNLHAPFKIQGMTMVFSKFVNPQNDIAFKRLFGQERNKDILIHFLNDVLDLGDAKVQNVEFLPTIQDPEAMAKKESIVDILCKDQFGRKHIIEMQVARTKDFPKRAQFYAARAYGRQLNQNQPYEELKQVIFLAITNFNMFPDKKAYKSDHVILDKLSLEHDLKDFSFTFLELPKFQKPMRECKTMLEKWTYFLKHAEETPEYDVEPFIGNDAILGRAYEELNKTYWSEAEMNSYESDEKRVRDNQSAIDYATDKGMAIGIEKGIEKGIEIGKAEVIMSMALRMLEHGIPTSDISNLTGLTVHDIEELRKK